MRIEIVECLRTVAGGLNPSRFSHRTMENSGPNGCKPLKEGCSISEVHYTAWCHCQPTLWSVIMGNWVGKHEWMIRSVKLAFEAKGAHVLLTGYLCSLPETFIWEEWWRKGAWEIWGMNEECLKCYFEHLIFQKPLYWDGNAFLGMRQGLDLDLLQLAHHCEEQDRNFIWNWWYVQQRSCYGKTHSMATNGHHSAC